MQDNIKNEDDEDEENKTSSKNSSKSSSSTRKIKNVLITMLAVLSGLNTSVVATSKVVYDSCFGRYERRKLYKIYGEFDYSRVSNRLERELIKFPTNDTTLQGYFYPASSSKGIVVVCHGMHSGADDYLPFIEYFVQNNFSVFTYDCKGTYDSDGDSTVGMLTPLVDLDYALRFLKQDNRFKNESLFLFGHSWGGFAVTSVLAIHDNIKACASVAPFNNGYTLIADKGKEYVGPLSNISKGFLDVYQEMLFKNYTEYTGVKGINSTNIPVLIAHGENDKVIGFKTQSIIAQKDRIRSDNVIYYIGRGKQDGHNTILHSVEAVEYQESIQKQLAELKSQKRLTKKDKEAFCNSINHNLYSRVNDELMSQIIYMFQNAL